jgi:hypothetical protein
MTERISHKGTIIAIIIKATFKKDGIEFFTPDEFSQQLGYMNRVKGYKVSAHTHKRVEQSSMPTHEVIYVKSGKICVVLYDNDNSLVDERILTTGDIILLASGGHSIEWLEDSQLVEIKQGPYSDDDKISFTPVNRTDDGKIFDQ